MKTGGTPKRPVVKRYTGRVDRAQALFNIIRLYIEAPDRGASIKTTAAGEAGDRYRDG